MRCGVPFQVKRASTWEDDSTQAEPRQANPLGQIPTLQLDDGQVMPESAAILIALDLRFPASGQLPADVAARAQHLELHRRVGRVGPVQKHADLAAVFVRHGPKA